jgi:hypothetical protein
MSIELLTLFSRICKEEKLDEEDVMRAAILHFNSIGIGKLLPTPPLIPGPPPFVPVKEDNRPKINCVDVSGKTFEIFYHECFPELDALLHM